MKKKFKVIKNKIINFVKKTPKKRLILYLGIFLLCIPALYGFGTFSRYVIERVYDNYLLSRNFYFNSNTLKGQTTSLYDWNGEDPYTFIVDVKNYIDELRWTHEDITYNMNVNCNPSISGNVTCTANNGTLNYSQTGATQNQINVTLSNTSNLEFSDNDYVTMTVTATSTRPYRKSVTATFKVYVALQEVKYLITDASNQKYFDFYISNYSDASKTITLGWNYQNVTVDSTNTLIKNGTPRTTTINSITYVNGNTITLQARKSGLIRFYKKDPTQNYTYPITNNDSIITVQ